MASGMDPLVFNVADSAVPLFEMSLFRNPPQAVRDMAVLFRAADIHIWLAPMYHGSMPGVMKNALDWLEVTGCQAKPYLTDKIIGMICWADGGQAMLGISSMDNVAKSLRAWVLPYTIPIVRKELFDPQSEAVAEIYQHKLEKMLHLLAKSYHQLIAG